MFVMERKQLWYFIEKPLAPWFYRTGKFVFTKSYLFGHHTVQTFVYNSILLTGLKFNCTMRGLSLSGTLAHHTLKRYSKLYAKVCFNMP